MIRWRLTQLVLVAGIVLTCFLFVTALRVLGLGAIALANAVLPKPPAAMIYISSPDDPGWKNEMLLSAGLRQSVILQQVPDSVRRVEIRYQIPMAGPRLLCDSDRPSALGESFVRRQELSADSSRLYQVVSVILLGRGNASELYGGNVMLNFCGADDWWNSYSRRTYFLGMWYGSRDRVAQAAAEVKGVTVDMLRPAAR